MKKGSWLALLSSRTTANERRSGLNRSVFLKQVQQTYERILLQKISPKKEASRRDFAALRSLRPIKKTLVCPGRPWHACVQGLLARSATNMDFLDQPSGAVVFSLYCPWEIIRFRPRSFRESSRHTYSGQVRPASTRKIGAGRLPRSFRESICHVGSGRQTLKPDSFSAISFGAGTAQRSFRKSFREQPASAKPSASFRAHSTKHLSETILGTISDFKSSLDNRLKKSCC